MQQSEKQNQQIKEEIRRAWNDGDLTGLLRAGFDGFLNLVGGNNPLPYQKFLEYTGTSFDNYILETVRQECLTYIGGKMVLEVLPNDGTGAVPIQLSADFYFQTPDKKWVMKKKNGKTSSDRFTDWTSDATAIRLQREGKLELSIEPPEEEHI